MPSPSAPQLASAEQPLCQGCAQLWGQKGKVDRWPCLIRVIRHKPYVNKQIRSLLRSDPREQELEEESLKGREQSENSLETRLQAGVGYGNTFSCIRTMYKRESVFGFFKGMSFPLASIAVYNSVVFGVFSNTQRFLSQHRCGEPETSPRHSLSDLLLASMVAGMVSVGLGGPVDLIKIRLQMQTQPFREGAISWGTATPMDVVKSRLQADGVYLNKYKGVLDCISQSYQQEGLKVFFRGITVNAVRGFPMSAAMFLGYELSLQALRGDQAVTSP
ncbi:solute carrier family 25 member 48 isoform X3 [Ictidomys tridecemlineatus]